MRGLLALVLLLLSARAEAQIADVPASLARIAAEAAPLAFDRGDFNFPAGGHLQGIQLRFDRAANRHLAFLSHDSSTVGYLVIVEFPADLAAAGRVLAVPTFPSDGASPPLRHAGGIQLLDDVLVVGLEDNQQKTRSEVQFWSVADPHKLAHLKHLTIRRAGGPKDMTAGAVGIANRKSDHLVAVANWDSRAIDFYASNGKPLANPDCRFSSLVRWQDDGADKHAWQPDQTFGRYQAVNLLADAAQQVFLVGFPAAAEQFVDLFAVDVEQPPANILRKLTTKPMRLPGGNRFQFAGGIAPLPGGPAILSGPAAVTTQTTLGIAR
jgi:hypothetical protein